MEQRAVHLNPQKEREVKELVELLNGSQILAIANMQNLPARQLQRMRETLRGRVHIRMSKRRLISRALDKCKNPEAKRLKAHLSGMPALVLTDENPFKLYATIRANKSKAPIKAGQVTPRDIVIPAGPTSFAPGPIIGELGAVGIQAGIDAGKVAIKKDSVVAKAGSVVDAKKAGILARLGIEPMEIGLDIVVVLERQDLLTREVLDIDPDKYRADLQAAARDALALSLGTGFPTAESVSLMLAKAFREARAVALANDILADAVVNDVLMKAYAEALAVLQAVEPGAAPAGTPAQASPTEPGTEDKEKKEADAAAGLGALFG